MYLIMITGKAMCNTFKTLLQGLETAALGAAYTGLGSMVWAMAKSAAQLASPIMTVLFYLAEAEATSGIPEVTAIIPASSGPDSSVIVASIGALASSIGWLYKTPHYT